MSARFFHATKVVLRILHLLYLLFQVHTLAHFHLLFCQSVINFCTNLLLNSCKLLHRNTSFVSYIIKFLNCNMYHITMYKYLLYIQNIDKQHLLLSKLSQPNMCHSSHFSIGKCLSHTILRPKLFSIILFSATPVPPTPSTTFCIAFGLQ